MDQFIVATSTGVLYGPFSKVEADKFFLVWSCTVPNLIIMPLHYRPVDEAAVEYNASMFFSQN